MKRPRCVHLLMALLFAAASFPAAGLAQEKGKAEAGKKERRKGGGPIVLEEIVIEGRVQKPQAFYILQRSNFGYKIAEIEKDYIDDILESAKDEVF